MKKSFSTALLILAFTLIAFSRINGQQPLIRIDSLPVPDALPKETQPLVKGEPVSLKEMELEEPQSTIRQEDGPSERVWVSGEFLLWKMRGSYSPPLITVGPSNLFEAGLDDPGTVIAFGGRRLNHDILPGARLTAGLWLNDSRTVGAEVSYFFLKKKTFRLQLSASGLVGTQAISRPYIFVDLSAPPRIITFETASPIAVPRRFPESSPPFFASGTGTGTYSSRLQGAEASIIYRLGVVRCCRLTLLTGFRYLDLNEALTVEDYSDVNFGTPFAHHQSVTDQFATRNQFYGGQAGLRSTLSRGRLSLELSGTIALGSNHQTVNISGNRTFTPLGSLVFSPAFNSPFGILATPTNVGSYSRNRFGLVPEVRASLGFDLTDAIRPFIGYQFLYWNRVVMPGEQIDRFINTSFPNLGPRRPEFNFRDTTFWAQGLTTGVRLRF